jgi:hypothetical protein
MVASSSYPPSSERRKRPAPARPGLGLVALGELAAGYETIIAMGHDEHPPSDGKKTKAHNLLLRLERDQAEVVRFAHDFRVPFSNNQAEQEHPHGQAAAEDLRLLAHRRGRRAVPSDPLLHLDRPQAGAPPARRAPATHRRPAVAARAG